MPTYHEHLLELSEILDVRVKLKGSDEWVYYPPPQAEENDTDDGAGPVDLSEIGTVDELYTEAEWLEIQAFIDTMPDGPGKDDMRRYYRSSIYRLPKQGELFA